MLTQMSFHSATICTIFKDYNFLLILQSSPFKVNIASKIPKFIGFMKPKCRFGHSKEKMDNHASLNHQEYQKYLLKLPGYYKLSKCSTFKVQALQYAESPNHIQI